MEGREYLSADEAGAALGVSPRTVRRLISEGKLRAEKPGRAHLIDPLSVEELKQERADSSSSAATPDELETKDADGVIAAVAVKDKSPALADGQLAEPAKNDDSSFAEATEDRSASGQEVDPVAGDDGDDAGDGRVDEKKQDAVSQLAGRVEKLGARVDRIGQLFADKTKKLEKENRKLTARVDNLKGGIVLMAVVFVLAAAALTIVVILEHKEEVDDPQELSAIKRHLNALEASSTTSKNEGKPQVVIIGRTTAERADISSKFAPISASGKAEPEDKKVARSLPRELSNIRK